jgi:hypothetical protein
VTRVNITVRDVVCLPNNFNIKEFLPIVISNMWINESLMVSKAAGSVAIGKRTDSLLATKQNSCDCNNKALQLMDD